MNKIKMFLQKYSCFDISTWLHLQNTKTLHKSVTSCRKRESQYLRKFESQMYAVWNHHYAQIYLFNYELNNITNYNVQTLLFTGM